MMRIAIDITPLLEKQWGGVSWYSFYITKGLVEYAARGQLRVVLFYNQRKRLPDNISILLKEWKNAPNVYVVGFRMPNKILNFSMSFLRFPYLDELIELKIKEVDYWILLNLSFIALTANTKYIAVCHDLSFEIFPEFFMMRQRLWHHLINPRRFYQNAHHVIAVSENTKQDLVDLYAIDPERIDVVYPGMDHGLFYQRDDTRAVREKYHLPENFILSVGTIEPRKNYETLLEAFDMLLSRSPILTKEGTKGKFDIMNLVIVGAEGWKYDRIYRFWNRMKHKSQVRFLFNVTREDLPYIYSAARLFVYPSFYEGFGFPPLEAAACGTPVIVSHSSSLPEIMGDAALYIDPFNIADLARAMERLLSDSALCDTLQTQGKEKVRTFTWNKAVHTLTDIINDYNFIAS